MDGLISLIGKFHPVILHLPIGFLLLACMMEVRDRWTRQSSFQGAISFSLFWGMIGAVFAAMTGYILSLNGGYDTDVLQNHKWLGIGVAVASVLVYVLHRRHVEKENGMYFPLFLTTILALIITGHYGGSLTHGSGFLSTSAAVSGQRSQIVDIENASVFSDIIQPILADKCVRCHSSSKTKGDLLMATIDGMKQGGKSGELFVAGDVKNSRLLKRIHLPIEEKEHMPPKGKQQLLPDEIRLLEWWIKEGADFKAAVKDVPKKEEIKSILQKFVTPQDVVDEIDVQPASDSDIQKLRDKGISIFRVDPNSPFVEVDLSRNKNIDRKTMRALRSVDDQLISLNLGNSNVQDQDLSVVKQFPHLQRLFLQQTPITDAGLGHLKDLQYLNYLNVYGTQITDQSFEVLANLSRLKDLYLWQTGVTTKGVESFQQKKPKTNINTGVDKDIFGDARLKAPLIVAEKDLFKDSILVELKTNFKNIATFYTLDGSTPDSSSIPYEDPIVLEKTANVQVISVKEGWKSSEVTNRQFVRVGHTPEKVTLNRKPNKRYAANGPKSLIDLKKGSTTFTDGQWLGYEKQHVTATLDLGVSVSLSAVTVGALEAPGSYIFFPKAMSISLSNNGTNYTEVISKTYPTATENAPIELANFRESFDTQNARYVRVAIKSNLVNPDWHPAPGAPCWVFIDEISVE